jgi:hypothetical protein
VAHPSAYSRLWLNQIEIVFSVIERKVISDNDFSNLDQITARLAASAVGELFDWPFTRHDLNDLPVRIGPHDPIGPAALPEAA